MAVFCCCSRYNCILRTDFTDHFGENQLQKLFIICALTTLLGGCATVTRGTTNDIQITSEPSSANVKTSLSQTCVTPCTLKVSRKDEFQVIFNKEGYKEAVIPVKTQLAGSGAAGFAGNILVGGVVGMGVDAYTGSTLEHVPNPVHATLEPLKAQAKGKPPKGHKKGKTMKQVQPEPAVEDAPTEPVT